MEQTITPADNRNQKFEDAKNRFLDIVFKILGVCWLMFFLLFRSIFRGVFGFIMGALVLYMMVGGIVLTVAHVFAWMGHIYMGH